MSKGGKKEQEPRSPGDNGLIGTQHESAEGDIHCGRSGKAGAKLQ